MIRSMVPDDLESVMSLAGAIGFFSSEELDLLNRMLVDVSMETGKVTPFCRVDEDNGSLVGMTYCEPERMTEGTWNLQLIAVHPERQQQGRGTRLLQDVEATLILLEARILLVETLGISDFEQVHRFYRKHGYREEARIHDFYSEGADKIVFWKKLAGGK